MASPKAPKGNKARGIIALGFFKFTLLLCDIGINSAFLFLLEIKVGTRL